MFTLYLILASLVGVLNSEQVTQCSGLTIVTREQWGARPRKGENENITEPVPYAFIHHTSMDECYDLDTCSAEMRKIQNFHMDVRGWDDIGYTFLIGGDGRVYIGRDWGVVGAHTYGYNRNGYGISFMGDFVSKLPTEIAMESAKKLIQCGVDQKFIQENYGLYGHRDGRCTECPGETFYQHLNSWDRWHALGKLPHYYC